MVNYFQTAIFQCTENKGNPTCATRLKVELNMADSTSMKNPTSSLNGVRNITTLNQVFSFDTD